MANAGGTRLAFTRGMRPDALRIFHRNSVVDGAFDELHVGSEVRFVAREGESRHSPQATTVSPIGKHHLMDVPSTTT